MSKYLILFVATSISFAQTSHNVKTIPASTLQQAENLKFSTTQDHGFLQGFDLQVWLSNRSVMGLNFLGSGTTPTGFGLEYPAGSGIEYIYGAAP